MNNSPENTDNRNVIDHFKYWSDDAIRAELDTKRTELILIAENFGNDFNLGTLIRNANAFVAKEVHIIGRKRYDKRGAVGVYNYEHIHFHKDAHELMAKLKADSYHVVAMDNVDGAHNIGEYQWQAKTALIFGQEQIGVSSEMLAIADDLVYIPQLGSTRSLNVGTASGIAIYDYMTKLHKL